jgi:hypothetical protein
MIYSIAVLLALSLIFPDRGIGSQQECLTCHQVTLSEPHSGLSCRDCHEDCGAGNPEKPKALSAQRACLECHGEHAGVLQGPMALREAEKAFVADTWGRVDAHFYEKNCAQCHLGGCLDCHGGKGHTAARPKKADCHSCHRGYYVGADYYGMAPREDSMRYQRGESYDGSYFLQMRPDVHAEAGLSCGDCHTMASLAAAEKTARHCRDCHTPDPQVVEHRIETHMEKLECYACHSAWAPQEYGTFFVRLRDSTVGEYFSLQREGVADDYVRSAYLRRQNAPPLGLNDAGRVSPIRPQFIAFFSDIVNDHAVGEENRLLAAQWKAFFPHTVRRGTVMCDGCHGDPGRFLLEAEEARIYQLERDGLSLESFWRQEGQRVVNGEFVGPERFEKMTRRTPAFLKAYIEKWKELAGREDASLKP